MKDAGAGLELPWACFSSAARSARYVETAVVLGVGATVIVPLPQDGSGGASVPRIVEGNSSLLEISIDGYNRFGRDSGYYYN